MKTEPLQQSAAFARALAACGTCVVSDAPVVLRRALGFGRALTFATRIRPEACTPCTAPHIINGECDDPAAYRRLGYRQMITPAHLAEWDLTQPDRRAAMHQKWRNRLVRAEGHGLRLRETVWDGAPHWLFAHADALARARRYRPYPFALLAAFARLNRGQALLFEAYAKGQPVAAVLTLRHGTTATYQTGWAGPQGRATHAHNLLLDRAATRLTALGHTTFDLGTVETDHTAPLAHFKLGTGANLRRLGGTWLRLRC